MWLLAAIYFCFVMGLYGVSFWLPTIIKQTGVKGALDVGLLTAIPYGCAVIGMVLVADGLGYHIPKGFIYAAMAFSVAVECLNLIAGRKRREH